MRPGEPSRTAAWCAALRGLAHLLPLPLQLAPRDELSARISGRALWAIKLIARAAPWLARAALASGALRIVVPARPPSRAAPQRLLARRRRRRHRQHLR